MLVLTYLKGHPQTSDTQLLRYLLSEVFDLLIGQDETDSEEPSLYQTIPTYEAPWQMLLPMRDEIGLEICNSGPNHHPAWQIALPNSFPNLHHGKIQ